MSQIMRLRRRAGSDHDIDDRNNGNRHEHAFVKNIEKNGLLSEADLLPDSYGGKFHPRAVPELISSLPVAARALARGKMKPMMALKSPHKAPKEVKRIFQVVEGRDERVELNLYISGYEDDPEESGASAKDTSEGTTHDQGTPEATGAGERAPSAQTVNADDVDSETGTDTESENS
jgi:succinate dehydrogenase / fumarate reductase iron-sulfur subunit